MLDDDDWAADFGDDSGVVEDQEIFNLDTGWSIQDFDGDVQQPAVHTSRKVNSTLSSPRPSLHGLKLPCQRFALKLCS